MRIEPAERIAGHPVLAIRELMRRRVFGFDAVEKILKVDRAEAERIVEALKDDYYICLLFGDDPPPDQWQTTPKGSMLAQAHARPPITRQQADEIVARVLGRVREIRDSDRFPGEVAKLIIFGSYLRDVDELNDVDLIVKVRVKKKFEANLAAVLRDRFATAAAVGLFPRPRADARQYVRQGVTRAVAAVSKYVSLHRENELEQIYQADVHRGLPNPGTPHRVLYEADAGPAAAAEASKSR